MREIKARHRGRRRMVHGVLAVLAAAGSLAGFSSASAATAQTKTRGLLPDQQEYVVTAPADPYSNDPTALHTGITGGQEFARSFVHIPFDRLPKGSEIGKVQLTLHITQPAEASKDGVYQTYNVNESAALLQACALTEPIASPFNPSDPPEYDCQHGSSVGTPPEEGSDAWTFDLANLVKVWSQAGNTGAAILPIANGPEESWAVSFFEARSDSQVTFRVPVAPPPSPPAQSGNEPRYYPVPSTVVKPYPYPTAPPAPIASPPAAPAVEPPAPETYVIVTRPNAWKWVLPAALALAAIMLGRAALMSGGAWKLRVLGDVRRHPRSYALASVTAAWALLFTVYSVSVGTSRIVASRPGNESALAPTNAPSVSQGETQGPRPSATNAPSTARGIRNGGGAGGFRNEIKGPGTFREIGNINVFFPSDGSRPVAQLYSGADNVTGIDYANKRIKLCGHAAMTYGPAFDVDEEDIKVFFQWWNDRAGPNDWKFEMDLVDDGYDPSKAVKAAQTCKDQGAFMTLGGIGFDQIPAVRAWAETNKQLYLHHVVTDAGSESLQYSFTALPSEEKMGEMFGRLAAAKFPGQKLGIIWRDSPNWQSGHDLFVKIAKRAGVKLVDLPVRKDQANYTQEIATLNDPNDPAKVVFAWENALGTVEMIQQARHQQYHPKWLVFPFNLETNTLGTAGLEEEIYGVAAWDAYYPGYYGGGFAPYANEIKEFEAAYRQYDPDANLSGVGGDLLFLAWSGFKSMADMIQQCGTECTRNKMAAAMLTYHKKLGGFCDVDFTRRDGHHGGWKVNVFETWGGPNGNRPGWRPTHRCVEGL